jgi:CopG antitoxin of type II toxin-antitoxin system
MAKEMKKKDPIPGSESLDGLAQFWQTHDLTDYEDEMQEVRDLVIERSPGTVFRIRLDPQEAEEIEKRAREKGVEESVLVKEWVLERLHQQ